VVAAVRLVAGGTWSERPGSGGCSAVTRWTSFGAVGVIR
jgi:hypothetical protein